MDTVSVDKSKEYSFTEAWDKLLENCDVIITSKDSEDHYIIEKIGKDAILKFYSRTSERWQKCTYILPQELLGKWYVTKSGGMK